MAESLPVMDLSNSPTGCCPVFNPEPWARKEFSFEDLSFIQDSTRSLFYIPLNMGSVMTRAQKAIREAGAEHSQRYLMLSEDVSKWKADHYFLVEKDVPGYQTVKVEGTWYARVFNGPFNMIGKWMKEITEELTGRGLKASRVFSFYTTCPRCAKVYGTNYIVIFARIR